MEHTAILCLVMLKPEIQRFLGLSTCAVPYDRYNQQLHADQL